MVILWLIRGECVLGRVGLLARGTLKGPEPAGALVPALERSLGVDRAERSGDDEEYQTYHAL